MKTIFNTIKQIFIANKEYFIRCTLMSIIAALIIGFAVGFAVPASAADDSTESDQVIISAGTYRWNDEIVFTEDTSTLSAEINFIVPPFTVEITVDEVTTPSEVSFDGSVIAFLGGVLTYGGSLEVDSTQVSDTLAPYNDSWTDFDVGGATIVAGSNVNWGQIITVTADTHVDDTFGTWFFDNTDGGGSVDPDPETYTIDAGWYLWKEVMPNEFYPHTLTFNYRTFERVEGSGMAYYSYWNSMIFDNRIVEDTNDDVLYYSLLYYSSLLNGQVLVYDDLNGGWLNETDRRFYISSPLTVSGADYFVFTAYTDYYGETPPAFEGEPVPSVPDDEGEAVGGLLGSFFSGIFNALDQFIFFAGFSLLDFITALLGLFALIWFLKLLAGG